MSFTLAVAIIVGLAAAALGLVCYHLLGRLERLERAVQGGFGPPSLRLSREQFERRFRIAHARSRLAGEIDMGILVALGPEATADHDVTRALQNLGRADHVSVAFVDGIDRRAALGLDDHGLVDLDAFDAGLLGVTTTPYAFVIDERAIRRARPLSRGTDLVDLIVESSS